jgi:hypothetical protein
VNAKFAGLIAGGGHHAPLGGVAYRQGFPSVFGIIPLLDGGVVGIHVDVYDLSHGSVIVFASFASNCLYPFGFVTQIKAFFNP